MTQRNDIVLSLIICSRNDNYMGDPMWRLSTSINYVSQKVHVLNRQHQVEIVVADWGSTEPIAEVIQLSKQAAAITRFIEVPLAMAQSLQQDSPFGEVYALNVAARRSKGLYIGRIDQDTLVTQDFLVCFFNAFEKKSRVPFNIENTYMFAARKQLPYEFVAKKPGLGDLDFAISRYQRLNLSEELSYCYWASAVGILMMHRKLWEDIGGYDERLIYYWYMDVDLATRLIKKYPVVNIGKVFGYHFFHLEHINVGFKFRHSHRKLNPGWSKSFDKPTLNPNGPNWGLGDVALEEVRAKPMSTAAGRCSLEVLNARSHRTLLIFQIILMSLKGCLYNVARRARYRIKALLGKPYL